MRNCLLLVIAVLLVFPQVADARTWRVPGDSSNIQWAISQAADGDTVLVADGTWAGQSNRDLDFFGKAITVRSENGPDNCIIDCEGAGRGFYFYNGEGPDSRVSGFTIFNGRALFGRTVLSR